MSLEFRFSQRKFIISHISKVFHLQAQQFKSIVDLDSVLSFLDNSLILIILSLSDIDVPKHSRFPLLPYLHIFICNISSNFLRNLQVEKESSSGIFHRIVLPFLDRFPQVLYSANLFKAGVLPPWKNGLYLEVSLTFQDGNSICK